MVLLSLIAVDAARPAATVREQEGSGPSLKETTRFVQEQLNAVGPLNYALRRRDTLSGTTLETQVSAYISNVNVLVYKKPKIGVQCLFSYHDKESEDAEVIEDRDLGVLLNDIEEVTVTPVEAIDQDLHPTRKTSITAPIFRVDLHSIGGGDNFLFFSSEDLANDIAKAITHAVELCVGGEQRAP